MLATTDDVVAVLHLDLCEGLAGSFRTEGIIGTRIGNRWFVNLLCNHHQELVDSVVEVIK